MLEKPQDVHPLFARGESLNKGYDALHVLREHEGCHIPGSIALLWQVPV